MPIDLTRRGPIDAETEASGVGDRRGWRSGWRRGNDGWEDAGGKGAKDRWG